MAAAPQPTTTASITATSRHRDREAGGSRCSYPSRTSSSATETSSFTRETFHQEWSLPIGRVRLTGEEPGKLLPSVVTLAGVNHSAFTAEVGQNPSMPSHSGRMVTSAPDSAPAPACDVVVPATGTTGTELLDPIGVPAPGFLAALPAAWRPNRSWLGLLPSPRSTPFTFGYLVLLLGTSLVVQFVNPAITDRLLAISSTDAHNMWRHPLTALLTSAFWIADGGWLPYAVIFAIAVAPFERRFGGWRTALVFFSGHVLATIATELPVMALINSGVLPNSAGRWLDIGVSYGFLTTAGALVGILRGRARTLGIVALELFVVGVYVTDDPATLASVVTVFGHAIAAHFGLLLWGPRLRSVARIAR